MALINDLRVELARLKSKGIIRVTLSDVVTIPAGSGDMANSADLVVVFLYSNIWKVRDCWMNEWTVSRLDAKFQAQILDSLV